MGWWARLFGGGHASTPASAPQSGSAEAADVHLERMGQDARRRDEASKIIWDYAGVLEKLPELKAWTNLQLLPESLLPYPIEVIQRALDLILETMEKHNLQQWRGVPKDTYRTAKVPLYFDFAPDAEVPKDPNQNLHAWLRWTQDKAYVDAEIKADPAKEDRLLALSGFPPEVRERMIQAAIARAEAREKKGTFQDTP
jgi:hypothetical protein